MRKLLIAPLFLLLLGACTDAEQNLETAQSSDDPFFVSEDSALSIANSAVSSLDASLHPAKTRTSEKRQVKSVDLVYNATAFTRSEYLTGMNTGLYIVNYNDDKGFAVVSSDKRLRPIYAVSDSGSLHIRDTVGNKGLAIFFNIVSEDIALTASKQPSGFFLDDKFIVLNAQVPPLLWSGTRLWDQLAPYNTYCFTPSGEKSVAGCVAVACGMAMSYFDWPKYIDGRQLLWRSMKKNGNNDCIAYLFGKLGVKKLLDMEYTEISGEASVENVYRTFEQLGYLRPNTLRGFDVESVCAALVAANQSHANNKEGNGPVLVYGENTKKRVGHMWVIDGYAENIVSKNYTNPLTYFHCVWGQEKGSNNGYFSLDAGQLGGENQLKDMDDSSNLTNEEKYTNLKYIINFKIDPASNGDITL